MLRSIAVRLLVWESSYRPAASRSSPAPSATAGHAAGRLTEDSKINRHPSSVPAPC